jgi:type IV pilus assembly protein PilP
MENMKNPIERLLRCALFCSLAAIFACADSTPAPAPGNTNKPVAIQKIKPETSKVPAPSVRPAETTAPVGEAEAASADLSPAQQPETGKVQPAPADQQPPAPAAEAKGEDLSQKIEAQPETISNGEETIKPAETTAAQLSAIEPATGTSELIQESLQVAGSYDPVGRFDPFEPLFKGQKSDLAASTKSSKEKRTPQTPLERVALSQLKVTAIIRSALGNKALVEDASGKGYVVQRGTYVGLNAGRVVDINKDRIVVEEEIENVMGELVLQNAELKLQKPAGEL